MTSSPASGVPSGVVERGGGWRRLHARGLVQAGDREVTEARQLDDDALVEAFEPEAGLERDVVRGAEAGVGGPETFASGRSVALGGGQPVAIDRVRGVDLGQGGASGGFGGGGRGDLGAEGVAFLDQGPLPLAERRQRHGPRAPSVPRR